MHFFLLFNLFSEAKGTFINDVPHFLAISDLLTYIPKYLVLLYKVPFLGLSWTPLPTLIRDVINEGRNSYKNLVGILVKAMTPKGHFEIN